MLQNVGQNQSESSNNPGILSESGPYGSVWAHILPEWILQGLGSLWDASRALKPLKKLKNVGIRGLGEIPPISPYYPGLGVSHRLTPPAAGVPLRASYTSRVASE